ncbi:hypothetical protein ACGFNV_12800 [Streptomyces sp. NPDC048751]
MRSFFVGQPRNSRIRRHSTAREFSVVPVIVFYLLARRNIVNGLGAGALK